MSVTSNDSIAVNFDKNSRKFGKSKKKQRDKSIKIAKKSKSKYLITGHGIDNNKTVRNVSREPSPYRMDFEFSYKSSTRKTLQQDELLKRLHIEEPNSANYETIIDLVPEFYEITHGRPQQARENLRDYIETIRDVLRTKVITGYRQDDLLQIEEKLLLEQRTIDETRRNFKLYSTTFEEFLYNDHTESMDLLRESERQMSLVEAGNVEYRQLSKDYGALRSIVYKTEEKWRDSKLYERFLYLVSPMEWREQYDPNLNIKTDLQQVSKAFERYRLTTGRTSLEDLLDNFLEHVESRSVPQLYFTEPEQLVDVFKFIEIQNLNILLQVEELCEPLENIKNGLNLAEELCQTEMTSLEETLKRISKGIVWQEKRVEYLQELAKTLINSEFKDLVISDDILNLQVLIEDIYEKLIGPNDANARIDQMMEELEMKFHEELLHFDRLPSDLVKKIERKYYKDEMRLMEKAEQAARKLLEFDQLFDKLVKVISPASVQTPKRSLKWRSPPVNPPPPKPQPLRTLTEEEINYLEFFTVYPRHSDNIADYGIDLKGEPKSWLHYVGIEETAYADDDNDDDGTVVDTNVDDENGKDEITDFS